MSSIFISYSRKDEVFVRRLATDLDRLGANVWLDVDDIPAGVKWSTAIQQGLNTCQLMIVVLSPDSMASRNVEDEWQSYLDEQKPVIPVLLRPTEVHFQLRRIQYVDFHSQPYEGALRELAAELRSKGLNLAVKNLVPLPTNIAPPVKAPPKRAISPQKKPRTRRAFPVRIAAVFTVAAVLALLAIMQLGDGSDEPSKQPDRPVPTQPPTLRPDQFPRLEIMDGEGAVINNQAAHQNMRINQGTALDTKQSKVRAFFDLGSFAVISPQSQVSFLLLNSETLLEFTLSNGEILVAKGERPPTVVVYTGRVRTMSYGPFVSVIYDEKADVMHAFCLIGRCEIVDNDEPDHRFELPGGHQVILKTADRNFERPEILPISPGEYARYDESCGGCGIRP